MHFMRGTRNEEYASIGVILGIPGQYQLERIGLDLD